MCIHESACIINAQSVRVNGPLSFNQLPGKKHTRTSSTAAPPVPLLASPAPTLKGGYAPDF